MTGGWHALPETIARGREEGQHGGGHLIRKCRAAPQPLSGVSLVGTVK